MKKKKNTLKSKDKQQLKEKDLLQPRTLGKIPISMPGMKNRLKENFLKTKVFMINMQLRNGKHKTMLLSTKNQYFKFMQGTYIIDPELAYDNITSKHLCLDYHQDFCLPIKRHFNFKPMQEGIEACDAYEVENSTNPSSLTKILEADIGGGVARSSQIPDFIKQMKLMLVITMVAAVFMLLLFMFKTGMLSSIKVPGLN